MNKIILLLTLAVVSCSPSKEDLAKEKIESHLLSKMNDAKSYEFVSIDSLQSYTKFDSLVKEIEFSEKMIISMKELVDSNESFINTMNRIDNSSDYVKSLHEISDNTNKDIKGLLSKIEHSKVEIKNESLKKEIIEYRTNINFRGKNALGALMLNSAYVRLDKDMKVKELTVTEPKIEN